MRSSMLLASALAAGAVANPLHGRLHKRYMVTEVDLEIKTVTVYVTAEPAQATAVAEEIPVAEEMPVYSAPASTPTPDPAPIVTEPEPPVVVEPEPAPEPVPEPAPEPAPAPAPAPAVEVPEEVYTPLPIVNPAPKPEPVPETPVYNPKPEPEPQPQPPAPARPSGDEQAYLYSGPEYVAAMLFHHNAARANHNAGPLVWDQECVAWAQKTADTCVFAHPTPESEGGPGNGGQGQNLFVVSGDAPNATAGVTESWYKNEMKPMAAFWGSAEIPGSVFSSVGHLTQLLWKSTTKVGCVTVDCGNRMRLDNGQSTEMNKFTVCNYLEPGNYAGKYGEQIDPPTSLINLPSWLD